MRLIQKFVRNDAMKIDPPEIYGWRVFLLTCASCFGGMLTGWDIGSIGGIIVMEAFKAEYKITPKVAANLNSNIVSALQGGCFCGALAAFYCADRFGRQKTLLGFAIITIAGIVVQCATPGKLHGLYAGRFFAGLGVGGAGMVTPVYISENAPRAIRGGLIGICQWFIVAGIMLAFWVNYGSYRRYDDPLTNNATWKVPLAMQALPAVLLSFGVFFCNESPRWLARQDNWEEATRILSHTRNLPPTHPYVQKELDDVREQIENEKRMMGGSTIWDLLREMWTIKGNRNRVLISMGLMALQQMTGAGAINYYAPIIFESLGVSKTNTGLFATGFYGLSKVITCTIFILFAADTVGRRRSLLWVSVVLTIAMYIIGVYVRVQPPGEGKNITAFGYVAIVSIFIFGSSFQFGWGPCPLIIISEIPTARLRALNVAMALSTQWLFNFVVAQAVPRMMATMGKGGFGMYFFFGSICFCMFFFVWFCIPETKGLTLEQMDELFGNTKVETVSDEEIATSSIEEKKPRHEEEAAELGRQQTRKTPEEHI